MRNNMSPSEPINPTSPDQPVRRRSEDRLGRARFGEALARAVVGWGGPHSLVVSLTGPWGSGKTSVKNFMLDAFADLPEGKQPDVLEFEPWQISGREQLAEAFMHDVAVKLGGKDRKGINRRIARRWKRWAASLRMTASLTNLFPKRVSIASLVVGGLLIISGRLSASLTSSWLFWIGCLIAILGGLLATSATAAEAVATAFGTFADDEHTLDQIRDELREDLAKRDTPLLIVIDDIDRLPASEIKIIFQLVKAVSDFPRLVFLLLFERSTVERSVVDTAHASGSEYLEKIIQYSFNVPEIDRLRLQQIFVDEVNSILKILPSQPKVDEQRWWKIYLNGADQYVADLRDVYRFVNGFRFHASLLSAEKTMEVNPVDLLGIEILRLFETGLYEALPGHRALLLAGPGNSSSNDRRDEALAELKQLLEHARNQLPAKRILMALFQPIEWLVNRYSFGQGFEGAWERDLRICSSEIFDRYFLLGIGTGDIASAEVERLVREASDVNHFSRHMSELKDRNLLMPAVDKLRLFESTIDVSSVPTIIRVLFDLCDDLPDRAPITGLPAVWFVHGLIERLLSKIVDLPERARVLERTLTETNGTYLPTFTVQAITTKEDASSGKPPIVSSDSWPATREAVLAKIRGHVRAGTLIGQKHLKQILVAWAEFASADEVLAWSSTVVTSPESAVKLLTALVSEVQVQGLADAVGRTKVEARVDEIGKYVPLAGLEASIDSASHQTLEPPETEAIKAFKRAMDAKRQDRPVGIFSSLDEEEE
jgi:predicted KAP-like P-loop ATPase